MSSKQDRTKLNPGISYFIEYGFLVNQVPMELEGVEIVNALNCYKVRFPEIASWNAEVEEYNIEYQVDIVKFYAINSGLLIKEEITFYQIYEPKNKYDKGIIIKNITENLYKVYKNFDGVNYPIKITSTALNYQDGALVKSTTTNTKTTKVVVNPTLDKTDFNPLKN